MASRIAAASVSAVGLLVLVGWVFAIESIKRVAPNMVFMNPVTAVTFIIAGASLLCLQRSAGAKRKRTGRLLGAGVAILGALKLLELATGREFGVDQWLFTGELFDPVFNRPNRIAPNTALNFALLGAALLLLDYQTRRGNRPSEVLCTISAFCAVLAIVGYAYRVEVFYSIRLFVPMALHTAVAFLLLAAGCLLARADNGTMGIIVSDTAGGVLARRLLPLAIVIPVVLGALRLGGERAGLYDSAFGVALFASSIILAFVAVIWWTAQLLHRVDTERRASEATRQENELRFNQIAQHITDVFWMSSVEPQQLLFVSSAYQQIWGRSAAALYQNPREWTESLHPDDRARVIAAHGANAQRGSYDETYRIVRPDGSLRWIHDRAFPVADNNGRVYRVAGIASDVTAQKESERLIGEARDEAERANRAKNEFLSRMSHELRTPLNAILGFGQLLELEELKGDQEESVGHIVSAGGHLLDLINEVLDISRIESGGMALSLEPVEATTLLQDVMTLLRPLATERRVRLINPLDDGEVFVTADRQRLKQVLLNLLSNAIKYNRQDGEVRIALQATATRIADNQVTIEISDTGIGLPPDKVERLFRPFDRLGAEQTTVEGTGLGLALSKRLVELMNGTIGVRSEPGVGSTFSISLHNAVDPSASVDRAPEAEAERRSGGTCVLLYIEDNLSNLKLVQRILAHRPEVTLMTAMQGLLGLELAQQHVPDVILLDLHLPGMNGAEILQRIRADHRTADIPVVMVSADATSGQIERLKSAGANAYLTKPFNVKEFLRTIGEFVEKRSTL